MKKFVFLVFIIAFQYTKAQAPDPDFNDKMAFSEARNHQKSAVFTESDDYANFDLIYQQLNFTVDPAVNQIAGSVFSNVKFLKDNISQIQFDLVDSLVVDSVKCNQVMTTFTHSGNKINITLLMPMQKGSISSSEIFYHGAPPQTGFGSFTVSKHNNIPVIWTLSEPYGARDWWPCKQSLADKIDSLDVFITCPSQYRAASNGKLISDIVSGEKRTAHWKHRFPIATYLVAIAVTNYETYSDFLDLLDGKKIEVLNYIYPEYLATAKTKSAEILSVLQFYNSKFITYPFASEKYGHAQFGWGGGMEHQTMSFMTTLDFELVAHEMAHQWFGDYITLSSWHNIWLNEGFATYLTGLVYENLKEGYFWPIWKAIQVKNITSVPDGSVYVSDTANVSRLFNGRLTYTKGAYVLHMLRWEMGDEKFFQGMKDYLTDPAIANGFASQVTFVKHMETAADTSFTEFFNDWYYGEGYPTYRMNYFPDPTNPIRQILRISQSPSNASVSFFEMHVPVRVWKDGKSKDLRLYNTLQDQEFVISEEK
ncbi:MAG TPA: M1 family aminopeptidase, partial [Prolixibacteraceae bacterium]